MDQQKVDMFLMSNANKFPEERMFFIREHLANLDDSKVGILYTTTERPYHGTCALVDGGRFWC